MLLANETVASHLESQEATGALDRIHQEPDVLKVAKFEEFVSGFGLQLGVPLDVNSPDAFPEAAGDASKEA